jgi:uncharacterized protein YjiS (DUF1127 family)
MRDNSRNAQDLDSLRRLLLTAADFQTPRGVRKGVEMITLKMISEKFNAWRRYRDAVRELSQFSDHELCDIGIRRCDIEDIVRHVGPRGVNG